MLNTTSRTNLQVFTNEIPSYSVVENHNFILINAMLIILLLVSLVLMFYNQGTTVHTVLSLLLTSIFAISIWILHTQFLFVPCCVSILFLYLEPEILVNFLNKSFQMESLMELDGVVGTIEDLTCLKSWLQTATQQPYRLKPWEIRQPDGNPNDSPIQVRDKWFAKLLQIKINENYDVPKQWLLWLEIHKCNAYCSDWRFKAEIFERDFFQLNLEQKAWLTEYFEKKAQGSKLLTEFHQLLDELEIDSLSLQEILRLEKKI